jgi:F-type H+-transporting ATPase subunit b
MFLQVDGTMVIQLINFAIFVAVLDLVFLRHVSAAIRRRREYINSLTSDYERYQVEAKDLRERAESLRAAARREAGHVIAQARSQAANEAAERSASYAQQVKQTVESATATVAQELDAARESLDRSARQLSDLMLERVLPESPA